MDSERWRLKETISIVTQRTFIFNSSLFENVGLSKKGADFEMVENALEMASDRFYKDFPQGIHTMLSEDGVSLSAGQTQRVSLARGFLKDSQNFIFDEPTDSLDEENEQYIIDSILKLKEMNKSILLISHKASIERISDIKYTIENGFVSLEKGEEAP